MKRKYLILIIIVVFFTNIFGNVRRVSRYDLTYYKGHFYVRGEDKPYSGIMQNLYNDGKVNIETEYVNGKAHGKCTFYSKDGKVTGTGQYKDGNAYGEWKHYHPNGKIRILETYHSNGSRKDNKGYDEKGQLTTHYKYNEKGKIDDGIHYKGGKPYLKQRDLPDGRVEFIRYENGKPGKPEYHNGRKSLHFK